MKKKELKLFTHIGMVRTGSYRGKGDMHSVRLRATPKMFIEWGDKHSPTKYRKEMKPKWNGDQNNMSPAVGSRSYYPAELDLSTVREATPDDHELYLAQEVERLARIHGNRRSNIVEAEQRLKREKEGELIARDNLDAANTRLARHRKKHNLG